MNSEEKLLKEIKRQKEINSKMRETMLSAHKLISKNLCYIFSNGGWGLDDNDKAEIFELMSKLSCED